MMQGYLILAFYCYSEVKDPHAEVEKHQDFLKNLDAKARIYIAYNGINGQMSLLKEHAHIYLDWLKSDPQFASVNCKIDPYHEHIYPRVAIKFRPQLVALDYIPHSVTNLDLGQRESSRDSTIANGSILEIWTRLRSSNPEALAQSKFQVCGRVWYNPDVTKGGVHVSPEKWAQMLDEKDENTLVIDVRNDYESVIGHFEGALLPKLKSFREFPAYAEAITKERDPKTTKVMMYCTGGIRCETYSALLREKGFEAVYQLEGGVINYGHKMGNKYWKGKLFVFDDRLSVPISEDEHQLISHCHACGSLSDVYYNCANMDCNELFLSCPDCAEKLQGCCSTECTQAKRIRPFEKVERPKPFRKWYHYPKECV